MKQTSFAVSVTACATLAILPFAFLPSRAAAGHLYGCTYESAYHLVRAFAQSASTEEVSETQARAAQRYNENVWFIQQALQVTHWDESLRAGILKMVKAAAPDWDHANPSHWEIRGPEVAARLCPWIEMAQTQDAPKAAAARLIADRIVVMEEEDGNLEPQGGGPAPARERTRKHPKSPAQLALEKLGAQFSYDAGSERYFYKRNWLRQAYELDLQGQAGELAFVLLMGTGFSNSVGCENGSEVFREVLRRGTDYLQEHHNDNVEARVHFLMGDAYRDIVALAAGQHGDTYADSSKYKDEHADARTKALAEYRAGLRLDSTSEVSKVAKRRLAFLERGETPHETKFYCEQLD